MKKKKSQILKWVFVVVLIGVIVYTFRDSAGPIFLQLKQTAFGTMVAICICSVVYEGMEAWITYSFARQYQPGFTYKDALFSAFYCSFYRTATLGSGAGVAAVVFFHQKGIEASFGTGMYMVEYVLHKLGIAVFSLIFFVWNYSFMKNTYAEYIEYLLVGYLLTILIAIGLVAFGCSRKLHRGIFFILSRLNRSGRFDEQIAQLKQEVSNLEQASEFYLKRKRFVVEILLKNILKCCFWYGIPFIIFYERHILTLGQAMAVTSISVMLAAVLPSPGGIGSTEFVFTALFTVLVGMEVAGAGALLYRFATFVVPFLIGIILIGIRFIKRKWR